MILNPIQLAFLAMGMFVFGLLVGYFVALMAKAKYTAEELIKLVIKYGELSANVTYWEYATSEGSRTARQENKEINANRMAETLFDIQQKLVEIT